ncbi:CynX/NimT family MFS transporter [Aeromicrobium sp. CF4.19]|uniref:MFS transporter n=1 Tax=Aeromicrobium sp. CF4.19 TaxID=3373082 RepID=UPI003EE5C24B
MSTGGRWLTGMAIVLLALNLRTAVGSIGVVLTSVQDDLGLSPTAAGVLTTLPMLCFALVGLSTGTIVRRVGLHRTTALALVLVGLGLVLRATLEAPAAFFLTSVVALSGAAIGNVVLPPLAKTHFPDRVPLMSALYGAALIGSGSLTSTFTVPVADGFDSWRVGIGAWAVLAVVALLPWLTMLRHDVHASIRPTDRLPTSRVARSPLTWALVLCFAAQSGGAYAQFGWFASILADAGVDDATAGAMLGLLTGVGIPLTLCLPWLIGRWGGTSVLPLAFGLLTACGWVGLVVLPAQAPALWAVLLGLGGGAFTWCLTMIGQRTRTTAGTTALSTLTQGPGYLLGGLAPFGTGFLHDLTGSWTVPLLVLATLGVVIAVAGAYADRSAPLEDTLDR